MTIKTKLQMATVLSLAVALVIGSILFFSARQVNEMIKKDMAADEIIRGLFELNILTNEYLMHHEERAKTQWQLKHDSIKKLLEEIEVKSPEKMVLLKRIRERHRDIKNIFSQMVSNYEGHGDEKGGISQELNEMLVGNLDAKSRSMVSDAYQLAQISSARLVASQQRAYLLVALFSLLMAVVIATVSFLIYGGVVKPIRKLHEGTEIIGAGNLNYKVGTMAKDEVGQLSRAFDQMTIQLKETFAGLEKEIAERKQAEERIRKLNRVYAVLSEINQAIVRIREPQELFEKACRIAVEEGGFSLAWIGLVDNSTQRIRPVAYAGKSDGYLEKINISLKGEPLSYCSVDCALRERRHAICNLIPHGAHVVLCQEIAFQLGFRSSASFPLIVSDESRGTFNLYAGEPDFFNEEELKLLDELAMDISFGMEFAEQETQRKRSEEALQASYRFLQIAYSHTEISALLEEFVKEIKNYAGCDAVGIRILDEEGNIPYKEYDGFSQSFFELESPLSIKSDKCMCINVIKGDIDPKLPFYTEGRSFYMNGTTRFLATVSEEEKGQTRNVCNQVGYESVALVPIRPKDRVLGLIHVADPRENMVPLNIVEVLEKAGMQLGTAIMRMRAEEEIHKLNAELEQRVAERTAQLEAANKELEAFAYSVSHDLRAPLRGIDGFSQALAEDYPERLDETGRDYIRRVRAATQRMAELIDALLTLSRVTRREIKREAVDLSALTRAIAADLQRTQPDRQVKFVIAEGLFADGDTQLLRVVLENLLGNAWKFTTKQPQARIEFGVLEGERRDAIGDNEKAEGSRQDAFQSSELGVQSEIVTDTDVGHGKRVFYVRDNGAGFDMAYADKLFGAFQRLHSPSEFSGTGIGLATVQRIIHRHGGRVWAEGEVNEGATFYFAFPTK